MKTRRIITFKSERGQSLVELAISLVVLLWLLAGAVEFGLSYFQFVQLRDAAQEGALYGSINPGDDALITARVRNQSSSPVNLTDTANVTVNITPTNVASRCLGTGLTVTITYKHKVFMPFGKLFTSGDFINIRASVTDTILVDDVC